MGTFGDLTGQVYEIALVSLSWYMSYFRNDYATMRWVLYGGSLFATVIMFISAVILLFSPSFRKAQEFANKRRMMAERDPVTDRGSFADEEDLLIARDDDVSITGLDCNVLTVIDAGCPAGHQYSQ